MIRILSDSVSTSDYSNLENLGIDVVSLSVTYDGKNELDTKMDMNAFNESLASRSENLPRSSQPSLLSFEKYFKECAEAGDSVVGVFMSTVLSSTLDNARAAARNVKSKFKEFECMIVDSFAACGPQLFSLEDANDARQQGKSLSDIAKAAKEGVLNSRIMFCPEDLNFLVSGGRLSKVSAKVASKLKIFPIITTIDGNAEAFWKVRSKNKAHDKMFDVFASDVKDFGLKRVIVQYAGKKGDDLEKFLKRVKDFVGDIEVKVESVSPVISVHAGPAIGISYECFSPLKNRVNSTSKQLIYEI